MCVLHLGPHKNKTMKIILWRCSALIISWALLGVVLKLINLTTDHLDRATWAAICVASASYLIGTTALLKPLTRNIK